MNGPSRCRGWRTAWCAALTLLTAVPGQAQKPAQTFTVVGRVVDSLAQPVPGAQLLISNLHVTATTNADGVYRLGGIPIGAFVIQFRKIGFGPVDVAMLVPRDTSMQQVTMVHGAVLLRTVVTQTVGLFDKPVRLAYTSKYDAFYERRKFSSGSGRFYTHEDIDRMNVEDFIDILRRVPHLQIWDEAGNTFIRFPHCGMDGIMIELDGNRIWPVGANIQRNVGLNNPTPASIANNSPTDSMPGIDPLDMLRSLHENNIEAMEVYPSGSSLPAEAVGNACAAIFVWSR
jgi:Carboxypeptidase regulatory-like domain